MTTRLHPSLPAAHGGDSPLPIDLSASLNPLGPAPTALAAARAAELTRYPDPRAGSLQEAAAARHYLPESAIVPAPGAAWGLWLALVAHLAPGLRCRALGPCFGEYRRCAEIAGGDYRELSSLAAALSETPDVCVLANPGNPDAARIPAAELRRICGRHPATLFVVDEAFAGFAPAGTSLLDDAPPPENAIVVRSLTKELALPGLRVGYLVASPDRAERLRGMLPAWPLSAPALAAAVAGCGDLSHLLAGADVATREVEAMTEVLLNSGAEVRQSSANYLLCRRAGLAANLAALGVAVRDCASFGLEGWCRIAAPSPGDFHRVLEGIRG